jgi:hypothetical protein
MIDKSINFKRIALAVVVALGFGVLAVAPSAQATVIGETLTVGGSTTSTSASITAGDTATTTLKSSFTAENANDSVVVKTSCLTPSGAVCGSNLDIDFYWSKTTDSATGTTVRAVTGPSGGDTDIVTGLASDTVTPAFTLNSGDSLAVRAAGAGSAASFTFNAKARSTTSSAPGVYTITFWTQASASGAAAAANSNSKTVYWYVTVSALSKTVASLNTYVGSKNASGTIAAAITQAKYWREYSGAMQSSKDSGIVAATTAADAQNPAAVGVVYAYGLNSAGETYTSNYTVNICASGCAITAVIEGGPGLVSQGANGGTAAKSASLTLTNDATATSETVTVWADGTPGTSTLKFYNGSVLLKSISLKFTGAPASSTISLSDTSVAVGTATNSYLQGSVKDSGGNALVAGTVYVFASDTNVVRSGAVSTNADQYTQIAAGTTGSTAGRCTNYDTTLGQFKCSLIIGDTGTATLVFRDSWTVAASSWVSSAVTVTGYGKAASYALSFDKTSYNVGELAVVTVKGTDLAGRSATASKAAITYSTNISLGNGGSSLATSSNGSQAITSVSAYAPKTFAGALQASETFVVLMPATSGTLTLKLTTVPESVSSTQQPVDYTASVTVVNPLEAVIKTQVDAAKAEATAATAAADAATDAALQAIDAANAATDAANLAAEAADAATVAAEEAKDAADAATAAVEALATQVATLMAALQAQIRSLANTVAKIAKKVKA